jgi:myosin heavy chain 9/10/11/14
VDLDSLLLTGNVADYGYLNKGHYEVDGVDDKSEFKLLTNALDVVGFSQAEQFDLFRVVAAILHIGNIGVMAIGADSAQLTGTEHEKACHLLGINIGEFTRAVLKPQVLAGREWVTQSRSKVQALNELGTLCKTLYEHMFGALVERVNRALERPGSKSTFIGVLDIAGFEIVSYYHILLTIPNLSRCS